MVDRSNAPDPVYVLRGSESPVTCLKFAGSSTEALFSGSQDGKVHVWDMKTRRIRHSLSAHGESSVLWLDVLDDGQQGLVTQGRDGFVHFWSADQSTWTLTGSLKVGALAFCRSAYIKRDTQNLLAVPATEDSQVDIYNMNTQTLIGRLKPGNTGQPCGMCMTIQAVDCDRNNRLLVGYEDGSIALWDLDNYKMLDRLPCHDEPVMCMCCNSRGSVGVSASAGNRIVSWKVLDLQTLKLGQTVETTNPGFNDLAVRPDQKILAAAGWDSRVRIFGMKNLRPLAVLSYHTETVQSLAFSSDLLLACGSKDALITLWDVYK